MAEAAESSVANAQQYLVLFTVLGKHYTQGPCTTCTAVVGMPSSEHGVVAVAIVFKMNIGKGLVQKRVIFSHNRASFVFVLLGQLSVIYLGCPGQTNAFCALAKSSTPARMFALCEDCAAAAAAVVV